MIHLMQARYRGKNMRYRAAFILDRCYMADEIIETKLVAPTDKIVEVLCYDPFRRKFIPKSFKASEIVQITSDLVDDSREKEQVNFESRVKLKNGDTLLAKNAIWDFMGSGIELIRGGADKWIGNREYKIRKRYDVERKIPLLILDRKKREFKVFECKVDYIEEVTTNHAETMHVPKYGNRKDQTFPRVMSQIRTIGDKQWQLIANPIRDFVDTPVRLVVTPR